MDELDKNLLNHLQSLGFEKSSVLAPRFGVAERTIRRRLSTLRRKGIIKIIATPNPILSGYEAWAKIGIKVQLKSLRHVAQELVKHPSIYFVAYCLGTFDIMTAAYFDTMDRLTYFVGSELTRVKGILSTETLLLTCPRKYYNFVWPEPVFKRNNRSQHHNILVSNGCAYELDEIDHRIMNILRVDGLTSPSAMKIELGIGEGMIRKRMKRMLESGVFRLEVVPNPEALEYEVWATMGITVNRFPHKVMNAVIDNPSVYLASLSAGRFNVVIAARFHNIDSLTRFINTELAQIPGVSSVETFLHTKPLKYHNVNWSDNSKEPEGQSSMGLPVGECIGGDID